MNDEFLSKLTQEARKVKLDSSEKANIRAKLEEFVNANPMPAQTSSPTNLSEGSQPFSITQFLGQHFVALTFASILIVVGAGIVSVTDKNPNVFVPAQVTDPTPTTIPASTGGEVLPPPATVTPESSTKIAPPIVPIIPPDPVLGLPEPSGSTSTVSSSTPSSATTSRSRSRSLSP